MQKYRDRHEAGMILAQHLLPYANRNDVLVFALPRGGVPVAYEIAKALNAPLDVFIVRKLGVPNHSELAMGALAIGGKYVFNDEIIRDLGIADHQIQAVIAKEQAELERREKAYRGGLPYPKISGKQIILVDDGIATGASMKASIAALKAFHPASIIIAVPVADKGLCERMAPLVDEFICPLQPRHFRAVGEWYDDFTQTEDEEVHALLAERREAIIKGMS